MSFIRVGDVVRIYYEEHCFDEGEVTLIIDDIVTVDFYDWIERWCEADFRLDELFYECKDVLIPVRRGEVVIDFRAASRRNV
jgi:hypothetical protein